MGADNNQKESTIIKDAFILFFITLIAGILLSMVNEITKGPIAEAEVAAKQKGYKQVFAVANNFKEDVSLNEELEKAEFLGTEISEILVAVDKEENTIGYVMSMVAKEGYGGDISFVLGVKTSGEITGLSVLSHSETAGLGANCTSQEFQAQFENLQGPTIAYTKEGKNGNNQIDALSGATITTKALTNAVNSGLEFLQEKGCFTDLS